MELGIWD